jgi:hypothetical protein
MVIGLQLYYTLVKFGSQSALGSAVGLSLVRELGPVLTAIMITARAGSAMTAEIGVQRISEQIDALTIMRIDQERGQAVVAFRVDKDIAIYSDAIASIKTRGLIGEKYLEIDAGGAGERLEAGEAIFNTEAPVDLNEVISRYAFGSME